MIYFIQHGNDGPVKIGITGGLNTTAVSDRMRTIQGSTPVKLKLIGFCDGGIEEEKKLHHAFRFCRVSNEWFDLDNKTIESIKEKTKTLNADRDMFEETISVDELAKLIQNEFKLDIYYKHLISAINTYKKMPHYRVFSKKRYKYEECKKYLINNDFLKDLEAKNNGR